jgi:hypothetical protein
LHLDDAFALLGVAANADAADIRTAFRARVVVLHPDQAGAASTDDTRLLLDAYRMALAQAVVQDALTNATVPIESSLADSAAVDPEPHGNQSVWLIDRDTIALACSHEEAFVRVLDVGQSLGAITYLDRQGDLIEVLLRTNLGDTVSLVISFQGRNDWIEAFLTTEVLDRAKHELPTIGEITELVAHRLLTNW